LARRVTSWHNSTRSTCRAHAFWLCRACQTTRLDDELDTSDVSRRDEQSGIWAYIRWNVL